MGIFANVFKDLAKEVVKGATNAAIAGAKTASDSIIEEVGKLKYDDKHQKNVIEMKAYFNAMRNREKGEPVIEYPASLRRQYSKIANEVYLPDIDTTVVFMWYGSPLKPQTYRGREVEILSIEGEMRNSRKYLIIHVELINDFNRPKTNKPVNKNNNKAGKYSFNF
jgi:hypothetical protein